MVKSMTAAWTQPHFGFSDEVDVTELVRARAAVKAAVADQGIQVTFMPFFLKAASAALRHFPSLNAHVNADASEVIYRGRHHIGFAVDSPRGLIVPNVKDVQARSLLEVAQEISRLTALAAEGKLGEDDLTGGTFTISNVGNIGGTYTSPVLVPGTVAIGALGGIRRVPRFDEYDNVVPVSALNVSWSADHRVVDGATMARFHQKWIGYLQEPALLAAELR
uniref:2-oxoacid dehydrogenase acyltransferase catalytic domain-containing protein n=1 Tax=Bicosoecida sp. CB-2014 TaxID=1486930 RepID=A0A7S1G990_9STRA